MTTRVLAHFLIITFGLTWGLALAFLLFTGAIVSVFGPLSMTNPLFLGHRHFQWLGSKALTR